MVGTPVLLPYVGTMYYLSFTHNLRLNSLFNQTVLLSPQDTGMFSARGMLGAVNEKFKTVSSSVRRRVCGGWGQM